MRKFFQPRGHKAGLPPGSLVYVGRREGEEPLITVFDYIESDFREITAGLPEETFPFRDNGNSSWINLSRVSNVSAVEKIGTRFNIHSLILEDILTQGQRPKLEDMESYIFIVANMLSYDAENDGIRAEQVSFVLGGDFLITFQEIEGDVFDPVRDRIRTGKGKIRRMGTDYLAYSLLDAIVDNYFIIMEKLGEDIERIEEELAESPGQATLQRIHSLRRELLYLRKSVWPLREVVSRLERSESPLIKDSTGMYFHDLYDHIIQVMDSVDTYRDMLAGILDTYLSSISNRLNDIMRVLTIISTIFIPLGFIAGVYGMNFHYMPELGSRWGYPAVWAVMLAAAIGMLYFFRRKRWF